MTSKLSKLGYQAVVLVMTLALSYAVWYIMDRLIASSPMNRWNARVLAHVASLVGMWVSIALLAERRWWHWLLLSVPVLIVVRRAAFSDEVPKLIHDIGANLDLAVVSAIVLGILWGVAIGLVWLGLFGACRRHTRSA